MHYPDHRLVRALSDIRLEQARRINKSNNTRSIRPAGYASVMRAKKPDHKERKVA